MPYVSCSPTKLFSTQRENRPPNPMRIRFTHQDPIDCGLPSAFMGSGQTIR
jgi:hypothetical protein